MFLKSIVVLHSCTRYMLSHMGRIGGDACQAKSRKMPALPLRISNALAVPRDELESPLVPRRRPAFLSERERRPPITNDSNPPYPSICQYQHIAVRRACRYPNSEKTSSSCAIYTHTFRHFLRPALSRAAKPITHRDPA
jgi:hypothetical protein